MRHPKPTSVLHQAFDDSAGMQYATFELLSVASREASRAGDHDRAAQCGELALRAYDNAKAYAS